MVYCRTTVKSSFKQFVVGLWLSLASFELAHALTPDECSALMQLSVPATTITSATIVAPANGLPEHCKVTGYVDTEIKFILSLPSIWNGKFYQEGAGGFAGVIPQGYEGLKRGYAAIGTDTGHVTNGAFDGAWAL